MVFIRRLLAKQAAVSAGFYEVVFVKAGFVTEGASSNVFAVRNGILYTPPLSRKILQGITRAAVLKLAAQLGIEMREEEMIPQFLLECEEVFITSTNIEVLPVRTVDQSPGGSVQPGLIAERL